MFWLIAASFSIPILIWSVYPLLKSSKPSSADTQERNTNSDMRGRWPLAALLMVLVATGSTYSYLQRSNGYDLMVALQEVEAHSQRLIKVIEEEEKMLVQEPDDPVRWLVLAQAYQAVNRYSDSARAYAELERLGGLEDNKLRLSYAEALILAEQEYPKAQQLLEQVLLHEPGQRIALYLYGTLEFRNGSYQQAVERWKALEESMRDSLSPEWHKELQSMIATAEAHAKVLANENVQLPTDATPASGEPAERKEATQSQDERATRSLLKVNVSLSADFQADVMPFHAVFIYARLLQGMPMPLAVKRMTVADLPVQILFTDADAMLPSMQLSSFEQVQVFARVSKSGKAQRQMGDFIGKSGVIKIPKAGEQASEVSIVIEQRVAAGRQ